MAGALAVLAGAGWAAAQDAPAEAPPVGIIGEAEMVEEGKRPWLGVQLEMNQPEFVDEDEKAPPGAGFIAVLKGGPAEKAGFQQADRVVRFDGNEIRQVQDLRTALAATKPGQAVPAVVLREGKEVKLKVVMGTMPAEPVLQKLLQAVVEPPKPGRVRFGKAPVRTPETRALDRVTLIDGNTLEGKVKALSPTDLALVLESGPEVTLDAAQVASARLAMPAKTPRLPVTVLLRTGGWLAGAQVTLDRDVCKLTQEDGGELTLQRADVEEIAMSAAETPVLYRGPKAGDGWQSAQENHWGYQEGVWQAKRDGPLFRKFSELPAATEFSFDAEIPPDGVCHLLLFAFGTGPNEIAGSPGALLIPLVSGPPGLTQCDAVNNFRSLTPKAPVKEWKTDTGQRTRYTILSDRLKGTLVVLVNGVVWNRFEMSKVAAEDLPRAGRIVQFQAAGNVKISNLALRPWLGQVPKGEPGADTDWIASGEAEGVAGEIARITPGEVTLAGGKSLPRTQPVLLRFKALKAAESVARGERGKLWVEVGNGGAFPAEAIALTAGGWVARTAFAEEYKLPAAAVRALDFRREGETRAARRGVAGLDVLNLKDGRQLTGKLVPPMVDGHLRWKISAARQPLSFAVKDAASLLLAPQAEPGPGSQAVLRLRNGDWLPGALRGADAGAVQWQPAFGGPLKVPRSDLQAIYPTRAAADVADGASGRQRWSESDENQLRRPPGTEGLPGGYKYQDGGYAFRRTPANQSGNTGIFLPIPEATDALSVEFEVSTASGSLSFQVMDRKGEAQLFVWGGGQNVQVNGERFTFRRADGTRTSGAQMPGEAMNFQLPKTLARKNGTTRVQVVLDPGTRSIQLAFNGQRAGLCTLKGATPWITMASVFLMPTDNREFRVSEVWIAPWNGHLGDHPPSAENSARLALGNGDEATGTVVRLDGETLEIDTAEVGRLALPLARIRALEVNPPAERVAAAYRVRLYDRGQISASALRLAEESVVLTTALGELNVPLAQVKEIVFATTL